MLSEHSAFESETQARERLDSYVRMLRRGDERNQVIADSLTECRRGQYCACAACPICVQGVSVVMLELLYSKISAGVAWTQASIFPDGMLIPRGQLFRRNAEMLISRIYRSLNRSSMASRTIYGGIDISLNMQRDNVIGWRLRLDLLIEGDDKKQLEEAAQQAFPPEPTAPVPYSFSPVTDFFGAIRNTYNSIMNPRYRCENDSGQARTSSQSLKASELRELLTWLGENETGFRLILRRCRRDLTVGDFILAELKFDD